MNLILPIKEVQIIHLSEELSVINLITQFPNPIRGSNATENVEFSSIFPRGYVEEFVKDLLLVHAHGSAMPIITDLTKIDI